MKPNKYFPFAAIVGQEKVKRALIINAINPKIKGVLISGQKGTAKSTMVRGLYELLEENIINIPLNITEDRLVGSLDIEYAIKTGNTRLQKGILNSGVRNIYIDEVNLLNHHITSALIEALSLEENIIEKEGISSYQSINISIIGSMNPEEGLLRPQLLDKFGLYVEARSEIYPKDRAEVVKRAIAFENNPIAFTQKWHKESLDIKKSIYDAREKLNKIKIPEQMFDDIANLSLASNCQGHRADILLVEVAKAISALEKREIITKEDIDEAATFVLPHRIREKENIEDIETDHQKNSDRKQKDSKERTKKEQTDNIGIQKDQSTSEVNQDKVEEEEVNQISFNLSINPQNKTSSLGTGKRTKVKSDTKMGRYIKYQFPKQDIKELAFDATIRAAALKQKNREKNGLAINVTKEDIREKVKEKHTGARILLTVDASGSMGARKRMAAVKGAVMTLLNEAYQKRDSIGIVAFRNNEAEVILNITRSLDLAQKSLKKLPTGGKTPLANGLEKSLQLLKTEKLKTQDALLYLVLISDGRANVALKTDDAFEDAKKIARAIRNEGIQSLVIDTESGFIRYGIAKEISEIMGSKYIEMKSINPNEIKSSIKDLINIK